MGQALVDFETKLDSLIRDDAGILTLKEKDLMIQDASRRYSADRPLIKVHDYLGDGAAYDFDLPTDFIPGFSGVTGLEYPLGEGREPTLLEAEDWALYRTMENNEQKIKLRVIGVTPAAGKKMRLSYTTLHTIPVSGAGTIPDSDFDAVAALAASLCCRSLAAKYAQTSEPTLSADVVNYQGRAAQYGDLANQLLKIYQDYIGLSKEPGAPATSVTKDLDTSLSFGGDFLFHRRKWR